MELVFQDSKLEYLSRILCETVAQEQTADVIIPDSFPDAERVVDAFGTLLIRSEECTAGSASVAGVVQAGVLFVSEQGQVQCVQAQIPFSVRREFAQEQESCTLQCRCVLRSGIAACSFPAPAQIRAARRTGSAPARTAPVPAR